MGKRGKSPGKANREMPKYRRPEYDRLSDVAAGRVQAGPQSTPPRAGTELDDWQDPALFHSPEL